MPKKPVYNYKFYATGHDLEKTPTLLTFMVYEATSIEAAKRKLSKDEMYNRILRKYNLSSRSVQLTPFRCDETGHVVPEARTKEQALRKSYDKGTL